MTVQLDSSVGVKKQSDFTTPATVDRFLEFIDESFDFDRTYYQGAGQRPGSRFPRSRRNVLVKDGAKGDLNLEVPTRGLGTLLELMLGVATSTKVNQSAASSAVVVSLGNSPPSRNAVR